MPPRETSCSIGEPLALGPYERPIGAGLIVDAEPNSVVVPEIELGRVAMQVRLADVEVAAVDPALEDREVVFGGVGVPKRTPHVFLRGVINGTVPRELAPDRPIDRAFVGHQVTGLVHVGDNDRLQGLRRHVGNVKAANLPVAFDQRQDRGLGWDLAFPVCSFAADISFVGFHNLIRPSKWRVGIFHLQHGHCLANAVPKEPRGFEATAEGAVKLSGRDTLLAGAHQVNRLKPDVQWDMARLENSSHAHREGLTTGAAFPKARARRFALQLGRFVDRTAMRADWPIRPKPTLDIREGGFFAAKLRCVKGGFHGGFSPKPLFYL